MGYRIEYNSGSAVESKIESRRKPRFKLGILCVVIFLMLSLWPSFRTTLLDTILPGNDVVTASALNGLTDNLENGVPLYDAVKVFCAEIINNGEKQN